MTAEVSSDYIGLRTVQEQLRITKENLRLQQEIYQTVKGKYDNGLADTAALNQAEYAVQTTKAALPALEQQEEAYKKCARRFDRRTAGKRFRLERPRRGLIGKPFVFRVENLYNYPLNAVRNRPDVRMAENALIARNAAIGEAVAELFPECQSQRHVGLAGQKVFGYRFFFGGGLWFCARGQFAAV